MESSQNQQRNATIITFCLFVAPIVYHFWKGQISKKQNSVAATKITGIIRPPFPQVIRDMLKKCRLAYLSTVDSENESSHLSLMRFTYTVDDEDGEVVILTTNKKTKKFSMLTKQKGVALLVHDFGDDGNGFYSITMNGECSIIEGDKAEKYRAEHLKHNPDYPQFIVGSDIAVLCIVITSASICNIDDTVEKWSSARGFQNQDSNLS
mmetsp:Transcript_19277/g.28524  ORF Transcript_19277/g.28524 Transcript_19277/m.28524 type:complete len:208 (+) Transcript_19277:32-655(+)